MEHRIVGREEWIKAQAEFVEKEKEFTRLRDELAKERRSLPWTLVEKNYEFETPEGKKNLSQLFGDNDQLFVQHFMFAPTWTEGCTGCSFMADHIDGTLPHLKEKGVGFVAISRGPLAEIEKFKKRMGWHFPWVSSAGSDFNFDFDVSFTEEQKAKNEVFYNFRTEKFMEEDMPGISTFYKDVDGRIYRTYSSYGRGAEQVITTYMMLDVMPKGRNEENFKVHPMEWVKHHDKYDAASEKSCCH